MVFCLLLYNDSIYCISNLLIGQCYTVPIISICYGPLQFCIVFISCGCYSRLFALCVKLVQYILPTFEYVKIDWLLENNLIIYNCRFLILCLFLCNFLIFYAVVDAF